ncbi:energy transducer TonB [Prevotella sp. P4-51]|uniref:energy transducer TonB n=1 Tax=unclassified Prevotella TaxID=2638335 RepID=UPI000B97052A|nr:MULTISPECIES: energy transducer TonB [unclassified Prevotella]OYP63266.1 energy transducer TonB [Prevotella sp. P5-108]OYP69962.1 energy transducer TonB [Prevotella sp. P4-67]OYP71183.1 energy transducer TonB [Prevotella sp. P5-64]OYP78470.1 energy transducer TonB [Prevotella sp. P4-51]
MSKIDLISSDWVDLVFEGRNKAYGAYRLRKSTTKRNILAMVAVVILLIVAFIILTVKNFVDEQRAKVAMTQVAELTNYDQPKKKAEVKQKKVEVEPERVVERVKSSIKFTAPVIKKDEEVKPDEELKTQDELMSTKTAIGTFDVKGNDDANGEILKAKEVIAEPEPPKHEEENKVFDIVEQQPLFPGGPAALMKYLSENTKYPVVAQENGVQGRVTVQFVVEKDGSISDVHVLRGVDPSLDKEAVRVVKSMPRWTPGKQNGITVRVNYRVPVLFRLQ